MYLKASVSAKDSVLQTKWGKSVSRPQNNTAPPYGELFPLILWHSADTIGIESIVRASVVSRSHPHTRMWSSVAASFEFRATRCWSIEQGRRCVNTLLSQSA